MTCDIKIQTVLSKEDPANGYTKCMLDRVKDEIENMRLEVVAVLLLVAFTFALALLADWEDVFRSDPERRDISSTGAGAHVHVEITRVEDRLAPRNTGSLLKVHARTPDEACDEAVPRFAIHLRRGSHLLELGANS